MKRVLRLLILAGLIYAGLSLVLFLAQRSLIYQPERLPTAELARLAATRRFQPWVNAEGVRIGWWRLAPAKTPAGTVLITHGNAGTAVGREYLADPIQAVAPWDAFVLEYPGYADRIGEPTEASLLAAAADGLAALTNRPGPLFLVGESLGSGVAAYLAGRFRDRVTAVCLLVPFNNLPAAASSHYPWLPVRWLLRDRFPSDQRLAGFGGRVAVVIGGADSIVPPELGRTLFRGYQGGPKRLWEFPGEEHWEAISQPEEIWKEIAGFLRGMGPESTQ